MTKTKVSGVRVYVFTFPSRSALNLSACRPLFLRRRDILRLVSLFLEMALHSCSHSRHATRTSDGGGGASPPAFPPQPVAASAAAATDSAHPPFLARPGDSREAGEEDGFKLRVSPRIILRISLS